MIQVLAHELGHALGAGDDEDTLEGDHTKILDLIKERGGVEGGLMKGVQYLNDSRDFIHSELYRRLLDRARELQDEKNDGKAGQNGQPNANERLRVSDSSDRQGDGGSETDNTSFGSGASPSGGSSSDGGSDSSGSGYFWDGWGWDVGDAPSDPASSSGDSDGQVCVDGVECAARVMAEAYCHEHPSADCDRAVAEARRADEERGQRERDQQQAGCDDPGWDFSDGCGQDGGSSSSSSSDNSDSDDDSGDDGSDDSSSSSAGCDDAGWDFSAGCGGGSSESYCPPDLDSCGGSSGVDSRVSGLVGPKSPNSKDPCVVAFTTPDSGGQCGSAKGVSGTPLAGVTHGAGAPPASGSQAPGCSSPIAQYGPDGVCLDRSALENVRVSRPANIAGGVTDCTMRGDQDGGCTQPAAPITRDPKNPMIANPKR